MDTLNWLDVILAGTVIISAVVGLARGFIKEVLSLVAWVIALYVAWKFSDMVAEKYVQQFIDDALISYLAAFGALFLVALFVIGLVNLLITQLFSATGMGGFDRLLGMLFGLARGALIGALIVFFASFTPLVKESWWQSSQLAPGFTNLAQWGMDFLPDNIMALLTGKQEDQTQESSPLNDVSDPQLTLESANTGESTAATRPQIDNETRHQQSEQNNAISSAGGQLTLESIEGIETIEGVEDTEAPPSTEQTESSQTAPPAITLESVQ